MAGPLVYLFLCGVEGNQIQLRHSFILSQFNSRILKYHTHAAQGVAQSRDA